MNKDSKIPITDALVGASNKLRVRSALNPILWLCGISLTVGFLAISVGFFRLDPFPRVLFWIIVLTLIFIPLILTSFGFVYILLKLPDMLQSEEYQLKKKRMELSQEKGKPVETDLLNEQKEQQGDNN